MPQQSASCKCSLTVLVAQRSRTATAGQTLAVFVMANEEVTMSAT